MHAAGYLVETQTEDGLRLNGFLQKSKTHDPDAEKTDAASSVDRDSTTASSPGENIQYSSNKPLWILVHGVAGNFYNSSLLSSLAKSIRDEGADTLLVNTRGRDPVAYLATNAGPVRVGAAYEMIGESQLDLAAWIEFAKRHNYQSINLLGHSLGAIKSLYYCNQASSSCSIARLILVSPPRLSSDLLKSDRKYSDSYRTDLTEAKELVESGKPEALMTIRFPQPMLVSAATFLDKYGSNDLYDYARIASNLEIPCLWCFGEWEVRGPRASFKDCDVMLAEILRSNPNHSVQVIPKADHSYTQARAEVQFSVQNWVRAETRLT